ncbi:hypothetical protein ACWEPC_34255 [Nonomuraea sp. NPDC004297]
MVFEQPTQQVTITCDIDGQLNGEPITGIAEGTYKPDDNEIAAVMQFSRCNPSAAPISTSSIISLGCSIFSQPLFGAVNLFAVTGGETDGMVEFRIMDLDADSTSDQHVLGVVTQGFSFRPAGENSFHLRTTLNGWHAPLPKVGNMRAPGYSMFLRQAGPGEVEGTYAQVTKISGGGAIYTLARRTYRYAGEFALPEDEVMVYRIVEFDERCEEQVAADTEYPHVVRFRSQAYYAPMNQARITAAGGR